MFKSSIFLIFFWLFRVGLCGGVPCCAGSGGNVPLVVADEQAQLGLLWSRSISVAEAQEDSTVRYLSIDSSNYSNLVVANFSNVFLDRYQFGLSVPLSWKDGEARQLTFPGLLRDTSVYLGYELLTEWEYRRWLPKGFVFTRLVIPSSLIHQSNFNTFFRDEGYWGIGLGGVFLKSWRIIDLMTFLEGVYFAPRTVELSNGDLLSLFPGRALRALIQVGVSFLPAVRIALGPLVIYRSAFETTGSLRLVSNDSLRSLFLGQLSLTLFEGLSVHFMYQEPLLLNASRSALLDRTFALAIQKKWDR